MKRCFGRLSWSFVQLLFLVVVILSSIGLIARSDAVAGDAARRVIPADWFNGAETSSEEEEEEEGESAGFNEPVKRRRMPFRSDLGKRFRLGREEEEVEQPFLLRDEEEDHLSAKGKGVGEKRRKFYRSDMGKRLNRLSGAHSEDFQLQ